MSSRRSINAVTIVVLIAALGSAEVGAVEESASRQQEATSLDQAEAKELLKKIVRFYRNEVGYRGAYLWRYSADLTRQEGEGTATKTSGWTQPPGSPTVGEAFLEAYRLSGEPACLAAAVEVAEALVESQLKSGGWSSHFDLEPPGRSRYAYRVDGAEAGRNNYTTFDDNKTQSAMILLMHVDEELEFENKRIHEAVEYGLQQILASQFPNGAWPQQYADLSDSESYPVRAASYPETWSRTYAKHDYRGFYTLNDNNMSRIIDMLLEAERIYRRNDCRDAALRTGDFFLLAQMPEPQPGWAQQYNLEMHPAWARKFEPPAITGGESQAVMRTLIKLAGVTGEERFIATLPRALEYYRASLLPDGRLARFYELKTNKPLYFDLDYNLTYDDSNMPTHYGFKVSAKLDSIERELERVQQAGPGKPYRVHRHPEPARLTDSVTRAAQRTLPSLDERGAWVESGELRELDEPLEIIDMRTFASNLIALARYAGARN